MFNVHIIKGVCPRPTCQEGSPGKIAFYLRTKVIRKKWSKKNYSGMCQVVWREGACFV